jgi:FKBP-type peptidyl-prolyl cis-trans isomerase FklB
MKTFNEYKSVLAGIGYALLLTSLAACDRGADSNMNAGNAGASPGYNAGYDLGVKLALLQQQQPDIELDDALNGLRDALSDTNQITSRTELCARLQPAEFKPAEVEYRPAENVQPSRIEARSNKFNVFYAKDDYAALNAKREGVVTLPSGVQYEVLKAGSGEQPQAGDAVLISYQASLADGTVFDTTDDDGEPLHMPLDDIVVPGLKEALLLMNAGARWQVVIPPSMGFSRTGNRMFRRRDLIYDIELISIDRAQPASTSY